MNGPAPTPLARDLPLAAAGSVIGAGLGLGGTFRLAVVVLVLAVLLTLTLLRAASCLLRGESRLVVLGVIYGSVFGLVVGT